MRQSIIASVFLLGLLSGCTTRDAGPRQAQLTGADDNSSSAHSNHSDTAPRRSAAQGIAAMPDRGQLAAFRRDVTPRRSLAYTWRPVDISEAHALHAIGGQLTVTAPDGSPIRLQYERHIEHADGNWTWVGRPAGSAPGTEAIITFGEKAVFGTIPVRNGSPLRITTGGGRTWMMETDATAIAALPSAHPRGTDALLAPMRGNATTGVSHQAASLIAENVAATASSVDLLIGYTSGFATRLGGQSQANTRLVNLVDIANQAFANSQIDSRVHLVKTMQVNYPDATANSSALYALTGCTQTTCTEVDVALQPLHNAREKYGADAITLVRNFNDPENGSCGIAWLIGGGQTPISSSDEYAAMSVVSDSNGMGGPGSFPDNGYVCRDETLAHELGHNMGSTHDAATSAGDDGVLQAEEYGRFPYSFGYKTGLDKGNFFTVMAYGDSGQTRYRVFSNPQTSFCGGRPCGVADQSDNARSLRQTIPTVATFRSPAMRPSDFNDDGAADILWRNPASGANQIWLSANSNTKQMMATVSSGAWSIVGVGDFNGDGYADVLWRNSGNGQNAIWRSGDNTTQQPIAAVGNLDWKVAGIGDFNGDGVDDIVWRNARTGANTIWRSGSNTNQQAMAAVANLAWRISGTGDVDGDGFDDIVWRSSTGANTIWRSGSNAMQIPVATVASKAWKIVGVGDFNGDNRSDLLWRNTDTGANTIWRSANNATQQAVATIVNLQWSVATVADFNSDGRSDVVWRNATTGENQLWLGANIATKQAMATASSAWVISN